MMADAARRYSRAGYFDIEMASHDADFHTEYAAFYHTKDDGHGIRDGGRARALGSFSFPSHACAGYAAPISPCRRDATGAGVR